MKYFSKLMVFFVSITLVINSFSQEKAELKFTATELTPGLYMLRGEGGFTGGNIGLSIGDDGVVMIDDSMPPMLGILKEAVASVTDKPISFLINTHVHGDHIGNNEALSKAGAHIVAHKNLRQHLITKGMPGPDGTIEASKGALPVITFSDELNFHLNGEDARVFHVAAAHTDGDALIHFQNANVIHTGDIFFNGMFPFIDLASGGTIDGFIAAQKKVLELSDDKTKIIAGHGPLATKKDLQRDLAMLEDARSLIAKLIKKGRSMDEVAKANPLAKYHEKYNWGFITTEKMTWQVYQGVKASGNATP